MLGVAQAGAGRQGASTVLTWPLPCVVAGIQHLLLMLWLLSHIHLQIIFLGDYLGVDKHSGDTVLKDGFLVWGFLHF